MHSKSTEATKNISSLFAGGLAGMTAKTLVAPLERVKIIYQVTNERFSLINFPKVVIDILRQEGVLALWRGHSASLLRVVPYAGIQFMTFDYVKRKFASRERRDLNLSFTETMTCGGIAGAVSTSVTYPLDLARSRLAVTPPTQNSRFQVLKCLRSWYQHGGMRELYRGLLPTLLGVVPYGAIAFSTNDALKQIFKKYHIPHQTANEKGLKAWHKLFSGAVAGIVAQTCTYPLEIMRRRMQTAGHVDVNASLESTYTTLASDKCPSLVYDSRAKMGMTDTFVFLYTSHGWEVFFKGISLNWIKGPLTVSISFTTFDFFKSLFDTMFL